MWKQFGRLICRAKDGNVTKINVNNGLYNQTIIDFVNVVILAEKSENSDKNAEEILQLGSSTLNEDEIVYSPMNDLNSSKKKIK